jgi:hypoxanthine phosphoribosyltransferase
MVVGSLLAHLSPTLYPCYDVTGAHFIVDDIIDTGNTALALAVITGKKIVAPYVRQETAYQTSIVPVTMFAKKDGYIYFPWEFKHEQNIT